jgi:hypothetical protein
MRLLRNVVAVVAALCLARAAMAQKPISFFPITGPIQNVPVDTRNALQPIAQPMYVQSGWSKLANYFPTSSRLPYRPSAAGTSNFPTPSQMPNADYLKSFQFYRGQQAKSSGFPGLWPFASQ